MTHFVHPPMLQLRFVFAMSPQFSLAYLLTQAKDDASYLITYGRANVIDELELLLELLRRPFFKTKNDIDARWHPKYVHYIQVTLIHCIIIAGVRIRKITKTSCIDNLSSKKQCCIHGCCRPHVYDALPTCCPRRTPKNASTPTHFADDQNQGIVIAVTDEDDSGTLMET